MKNGLTYKPLQDNHSFLSLTYKSLNEKKAINEPHLVVDVLQQITLDDFLTDLDGILTNVQYWKDTYEYSGYIKTFVHQQYVPYEDYKNYYLLGEREECKDEVAARLLQLDLTRKAKEKNEEERVNKKIERDRKTFERLKRKFEGS